jgi:hypothetical protein
LGQSPQRDLHDRFGKRCAGAELLTMAECGFAWAGCLCSGIVGPSASGAGAHAMGSRSSQADCGPSVGLRGGAAELGVIGLRSHRSPPHRAWMAADARAPARLARTASIARHRPAAMRRAGGRLPEGAAFARACALHHAPTHAIPRTPFRARRSAHAVPRPRTSLCARIQDPARLAPPRNAPTRASPRRAKDGAQVIARQIFARTPLPRMILARTGAAPRCAAIWLRTWPPVVAPVDAAPSPPHDAATRRRS